MNGILLRRITEARQRLIVHDFLRLFPWILLVTLGLLLLARSLAALWFWSWTWTPAAVAVIALPALIAAVMAVWRWRKKADVAREIDRRLAVQDRFSTALSLRGESALDALAQQEISAFASTQKMSGLCPWRVPKSAFWIVLPLVGLAIVEMAERHRSMERAPEIAQAREILNEVKKAAEKQTDPKLDEIARELEEATEKLASSTDPMREALRSLDEAQRKAQSSNQNGALSAAESSALADALAQGHGELAENLRQGNNAEAASQMASLDPAELSRVLKEAERHVKDSRLREMSRQNEGLAKSQLIESLSPGDGRGRKKFVSMVDDIKNGTTPSKEQNDGQNGEDSQSPEGQEQGAPSSQKESDQNGSPGSEKDTGQGAEMNGNANSPNAETAMDDFIPGLQDGGPSLVQIYRQAGNDDAKARQAYRSIYEASAPASLDAVAQEEIPMGSRILIRRYFESIRPKE